MIALLLACLSIISLKKETMDPLAFVLEVSVSTIRKSQDLTKTRVEFLKLMYFWALYIAGQALAYSHRNRLEVRLEGEWILDNCSLRARACSESDLASLV